jgi:hypothetical protein
MDALVACIEGIGWWSPGIVGWDTAAGLLRGDAAAATTDAGRPAATILPPNERRRAPEPVLLACDVAAQACTMAARAPADLPCVFASVHGDIAITDELCATLANDPFALSPTRFHNSVHNAPAGYWTVAARCHAASSAVSAWRGSFAAGLLEAAVQSHTEQTPIVFAAYDIAARGPLVGVVHSLAPFATALVVNHERGPRTCAALHLRHAGQDALPPTPPPSAWATLAGSTPLAESLPLFIALARADRASIRLRNGAATTLVVEVRP